MFRKLVEKIWVIEVQNYKICVDFFEDCNFEYLEVLEGVYFFLLSISSFLMWEYIVEFFL